MSTFIASFSLSINTYDVIIAQPFRYALVLGVGISAIYIASRMRCLCEFRIKDIYLAIKQQQKQDFILNIEEPMTLI